MLISTTVLFVLGALIMLIGMLAYELIKSLRSDRDLYRELYEQSEERSSQLVAELFPEASDYNLAVFNAKFDRSQLN